MLKEIILDGRPIRYVLQRKKVKNINIRIKRDLSVNVSASVRVSQEDIERILREKSKFILSAIQKYESLQENKAVAPDPISGAVVFGKPLAVNVTEGKKTSYEITDDGISISLKSTSDSEQIKKAIDRALEDCLRETVDQLCREAYPKFEKYTQGYPTIKFRKMKTRWGSCNAQKNQLTFNYSLVHAPKECVRYVVYHEFSHFIHLDHSASFYNELSRHIPNHKDLRQELNRTNIN